MALRSAAHRPQSACLGDVRRVAERERRDGADPEDGAFADVVSALFDLVEAIVAVAGTCAGDPEATAGPAAGGGGAVVGSMSRRAVTRWPKYAEVQSTRTPRRFLNPISWVR